MLTDEARNSSWLLTSFVEETAGVTDAMAVSSDGLLIARSDTGGGRRAGFRTTDLVGPAGRRLTPALRQELRKSAAGGQAFAGSTVSV